MCKDAVLQRYNGIGRSFYLCSECLNEGKKIKKALSRVCKKEIKLTDLEKIIYG